MSTITWSGSGRAAERISIWLMAGQSRGAQTRARILPEAVLPSLFARVFPGKFASSPAFAAAHDRQRLPAPALAARPGLLRPTQPRADGLDAYRPGGSRPRLP